MNGARKGNTDECGLLFILSPMSIAIRVVSFLPIAHSATHLSAALINNLANFCRNVN
jgi:hypothetical protein